MNGVLWFRLMTSGLLLVLAMALGAVWGNTRVQRWCGRTIAAIALTMMALALLLIWGGVHP